MSYEPAVDIGLDYYPCKYGTSRLTFRGPKGRADGNHIAVLGGTQTYGRFVVTPYAEILAELTDRTVLNLGQPNAGVDAFLGEPAVLELCRSAAVTVIEVPGAQNITNRFYSVHPRRNDRFLRASKLLRSLCCDLDLVDVHYTRHLMTRLEDAAPDRFPAIVKELKETWMTRMTALIDGIGGAVILLYLSDRGPAKGNDDPLNGRGPLFVTQQMVAALGPKVADVVEVVADASELAAGYAQMRFSDLDAPAAREMLGPVVHRRVARRLAESIFVVEAQRV